MAWEADVKEVVDCCNRFNIRIDARAIGISNETPSFNISVFINHVRLIKNQFFFSDLSRLIANDHVRINIELYGKVYYMSLRCLGILCTIILKPGILTLNTWTDRFGMHQVIGPIKLLPNCDRTDYSSGIFIGSEVPLYNIGTLDFIITAQVDLDKNISMHKCKVDYNQMIKIVNMFESMHAHNKNLYYVMTFVSGTPVIVLLEGYQILRNAALEKSYSDAKFPINRVCQYEQICTKPACAFTHSDKCVMCRAYCSPAHLSQSHREQPELVMHSMKYIYKIVQTSHDPEVDAIRKKKMGVRGEVKLSRVKIECIELDEPPVPIKRKPTSDEADEFLAKLFKTE